MFNAYDIRGIYNKDFNAETVYRIGYFLKELHGADKIAVCRDLRSSSDEIFEYLSKGITDSGADVYDFGVTTTPESYFIANKYDFDTTVMITASHNPKEYNGFKISGKNAVPVGLDNGLDKLKNLTYNGEIVVSDSKGKVFKENANDDYAEFLRSKLKIKGKLNAVLDLCGGSATQIAKDVFGKKAEYIFDESDGSFEKHNPNPMLKESRKALVNEVKERKADIGILFDGDADRIVLIDNKGKFVSPDLVINLLAYYLLDGINREKVIMDIRSSKSCAFYVREMGSTAIVWKVGHAYAKKRMREENAILGGELAGHYYFRDFFYCDSGILAAVYILNIVSELKKDNIRLSDIMQEFSLFSHSGEINFTVEDKNAVINKIRDYYDQKDYIKFYDFDGIRYDFDEWWFSVRVSNTEPYLRLVVEADNKDIMNKKIEEISGIIKSV